MKSKRSQRVSCQEGRVLTKSEMTAMMTMRVGPAELTILMPTAWRTLVTVMMARPMLPIALPRGGPILAPRTTLILMASRTMKTTARMSRWWMCWGGWQGMIASMRELR